MSVAVAPGSMKVLPTVSIIAAAPLRVTTGGVVSEEAGVLVAVVETGAVEEAVLMVVEAVDVVTVPVLTVELVLVGAGAGPRFTVPSGFPTMTLLSAVELLPAWSVAL